MLPELQIFPADSVAVSLTTTVWVGVIVVAFFNLRFGWSMAGLTVPGYIVPLLMCKPTSAVIIFFEALLTFWLVYFISEGPKRSKYWCSFFGRDRFLALVIGSVVVRALLEGWLLPWIGPHLDEWTGWQIDYRNDLHSYGLIIVSLMANYFWKPGVIRGTGALATVVGITFLIVRYPLVELTNLNIADVSSLYEDISTSLLASPKAYIVILTSAWIASWLNLKYAWDYNGILIPSLLALLWYNPWKVFGSFVEAGVVLYLAKTVLSAPCFKRVNVEGARRIALFFSICFFYRLVLCHLIQNIYPSLRMTDLFGFGYLLTTLLAVKAHQKKLTARLVKATVQASTMGAVAGNLIGFLMTLLPMTLLSPAPEKAWATASYELAKTDQPLARVVRRDKLFMYQQKTPESYVSPLPGELSHFRGGIELVKKYIRSKQSRDLDAARVVLQSANFELSVVQDRYLHIHERAVEAARGWGVYVFDMENPEGLLVGIPDPLPEQTLESGLCLFQEFDASVLAINSSQAGSGKSGNAGAAGPRGNIYSVFHEVMKDHGTLHIRSKRSAGKRKSDKSAVSELTTLCIEKNMPAGLNLREAKSLTSSFDIKWNQPATNSNWSSRRFDSGYAELWLNDLDRRQLHRRLVTGAPASDGALASESGFEVLSQPLNPFLMQVRDRMARKDSDLFIPARTEELLLLDAEVLQPLFRVASRWKDELPEEQLNTIASAASIVGYTVTAVIDERHGEECLILHEPGMPQRFWGTFVFRKGLASQNIVEVPRPLLERQSLEFGASLFVQLDASALFIGGSHPFANRDGSSDLARRSNKVNAFNLVHQAFLRELGSRPMLVIQSRSIRSPVQADVVMAADNGASLQSLSANKQQLHDSLNELGLSVVVVDGRPSTAGYEVGILMQATSLNHAENKELVSLWVSPTLRSHYRSSDAQLQVESQFQSLDIPLVDNDLIKYVEKCAAECRSDVSCLQDLPDGFRREMEQYLQRRDIVQLDSIIGRDDDYQFGYIKDDVTGQIFLAVRPTERHLPWIINVTGAIGDEARMVSAPVGEHQPIIDYVRSRATWLKFSEVAP